MRLPCVFYCRSRDLWLITALEVRYHVSASRFYQWWAGSTVLSTLEDLPDGIITCPSPALSPAAAISSRKAVGRMPGIHLLALVRSAMSVDQDGGRGHGTYQSCRTVISHFMPVCFFFFLECLWLSSSSANGGLAYLPSCLIRDSSPIRFIAERLPGSYVFLSSAISTLFDFDSYYHR